MIFISDYFCCSFTSISTTSTRRILVHSRQATHQSLVWYVVRKDAAPVANKASTKSRSYEASMTRSYSTNHVIAKNECTYKLPLHWRFGLSQIDPTTDRHKIAARLTLRHNFCFVEPRPAGARGGGGLDEGAVDARRLGDGRHAVGRARGRRIDL